MGHNLISHFPIFGHLEYLPILDIINNEALNIIVLADFPSTFGLSPWSTVPEVELLG